MPDENMVPEETPKGSNLYDVAREAIRAFRDIFNDWRVATAFLVVILLIAGKVAGGELMAGVESWIRAWRGVP